MVQYFWVSKEMNPKLIYLKEIDDIKLNNPLKLNSFEWQVKPIHNTQFVYRTWTPETKIKVKETEPWRPYLALTVFLELAQKRSSQTIWMNQQA